MLKNPFLNAFVAAAYIVLIVLSIGLSGKAMGEETIVAPMAMLSLLVLSVALMGVLFFYQPLSMFLDGDRNGALKFFLKTLGTFACFVLLFVVLMFTTSGLGWNSI